MFCNWFFLSLPSETSQLRQFWRTFVSASPKRRTCTWETIISSRSEIWLSLLFLALSCPLSFSGFLRGMIHLSTLTISSLGLDRVLRAHVLDIGSGSLSVSLACVLLFSPMFDFHLRLHFHLRFRVGRYAPKWPWHQLMGAHVVHQNWMYLISNSNWVFGPCFLLINGYTDEFCLTFIEVYACHIHLLILCNSL